MLLNTLMRTIRRIAGGSRFTSQSRRRRDPWNTGLDQSTESLEPRVLLTIDVNQRFLAPGGPIAQVSERFDANASFDLVTLGADGRLTVALNGGSGSWSSIQTLDLGLGTSAGLTSGRINSDPFADLVVQTTRGLKVLLSDGAGGFTVSQTLTDALPGQFARSGNGPIGLTLGLFDQDFLTDLAVVVPGTHELLVYRGLRNGLFGSPTRYSSGGTEPVSVVSGQFVGESFSDLAVAHRDGTVTWFAGHGAGLFSLDYSQTILSANGINPAVIQSMTAADINGDRPPRKARKGEDAF